MGRKGDGGGGEGTRGEHVLVPIPYGIKLQVVRDTQPGGKEKVQ